MRQLFLVVLAACIYSAVWLDEQLDRFYDSKFCKDAVKKVDRWME